MSELVRVYLVINTVCKKPGNQDLDSKFNDNFMVLSSMTWNFK